MRWKVPIKHVVEGKMLHCHSDLLGNHLLSSGPTATLVPRPCFPWSAPHQWLIMVWVPVKVYSWETWDSYPGGFWLDLGELLLNDIAVQDFFDLPLFPFLSLPLVRPASGSKGSPYFSSSLPCFPSQVFSPSCTSHLVLVPVSGRYVKHFYCVTKIPRLSEEKHSCACLSHELS